MMTMMITVMMTDQFNTFKAGFSVDGDDGQVTTLRECFGVNDHNDDDGDGGPVQHLQGWFQ